jgi:hypothetical protein
VREWSLDSSGRIWRAPAFLFLAVQLRWRELRHGRSWALVISYNKAFLFFLWRLSNLVLRRGTKRLWATFLTKPPRWWFGEDIEAGEAFFNKWKFLECYGFLLQLLSLL